MSAKERRKGADIEREIVDRHQEIGVHAERYPLSGASRFRGQGHDIDVYAFGTDECPLVAEVKGRKGADGFRMLERWLDDNDVLFLRRSRSEPFAVLPWRVWERLLKELARWRLERSVQLLDETLGRRAERVADGGDNGKVVGEGIGKRRRAAPPVSPLSPPVAAEASRNGDASRPPRRVAPRQARA